MPKSLTFESKHANRHVSQPLLSGVFELHCPCYWHYGILFALTVSETGQISDEHCSEVLDFLEISDSDGGFPPSTATTGTPTQWCQASASRWPWVASVRDI